MWFILITLMVSLGNIGGWWLPEEAVNYAIETFERAEGRRSAGGMTNRDASPPFISGDGFRAHCPHTCDETNNCRMWPDQVTNGSCIFVKADLYPFFARSVIPRIPGTYVVVSHNGDLSTPDGQSDAPQIRMQMYRTSHIIKKEFNRGRLLAHHGTNLWWHSVHHKNNTHVIRERPPHLHCLPIGIEDRLYSIGRNPRVYIDALRKHYVQADEAELQARAKLRESRQGLLLVAFTPKSRIPDRAKALKALRVDDRHRKDSDIFYDYHPEGLSHEAWLESIVTHKFVLAPHGHGLDTHRITEILLMGGVPVMRRSSITSCYDDSDSVLFDRQGRSLAWPMGPDTDMKKGGTQGRGSLPVVVVDTWEDVTAERLRMEWERLQAVPAMQWDWRRLFIQHWLDRIDAHGATTNPKNRRLEEHD